MYIRPYLIPYYYNIYIYIYMYTCLLDVCYIIAICFLLLCLREAAASKLEKLEERYVKVVRHNKILMEDFSQQKASGE